MKEKMNVVRFLRTAMLIAMVITSACSPMDPLPGDPQGIRTIFDVYDIPGENDPLHSLQLTGPGKIN
jgi:hypothetical protein